jgi:transcriptional regulator GlxA family with amidase domain
MAEPSLRTRQIALVGYSGVQSLDIVGPLEVFARTARWLSDRRLAPGPVYATELVGLTAGPIATSGGLALSAQRSFREVDAADTLLVAGGIGWEAAAADPDLLDWLRSMAPKVQRFGSICTGSLVLAAAGLLGGRRATTHWAYFDDLARLAPDCSVEPNAIFVQDGRLFTSAGVTTGMDMALELVEQDHGKAVAVGVAQALVIYRKRPGGQAQFSRFLEAEKRDDRLGELQLWILDHLEEDLPLERLAGAAGMSARHFSRRFKDEMGTTPAAYVGRLRLEEARRRLESGAHSLKDVARTCGFADEQNLRRAFRKHVGVAPSEYRERFG